MANLSGWMNRCVTRPFSLALYGMTVVSTCGFASLNLADDPPPGEYVASDTEDMDGDSINDEVIADPTSDTQPGEVEVHSGIGGSLIVRIRGGLTGDRFGHSVAVVKDLNADEARDLLIGAPMEGAGRAYVFDGPFDESTPLVMTPEHAAMAFESPRPEDYLFGDRVAPASDIDSDGLTDIRIRAWFDDPQLGQTMRTYIIGGNSGEPIYVIDGTDPFNPWQDVLGDADGDGDVDADDEQIVLTNLGLTGQPGELRPEHGDFNGDGVVDGVDLALAVSNIGTNIFIGIVGVAPPCPEIIPPGFVCLLDCDGNLRLYRLNVRPQCEEIIICPGPGCFVQITPREPLPFHSAQCVFERITLEAYGPGFGAADWWFDPTDSVSLISPSYSGRRISFRPVKLMTVVPHVMRTWCGMCFDDHPFESEWLDFDGDGLPNAVDTQVGLNPLDPDSDNDGVSDGDEDSDGDGLSNADEIALGFWPWDADSDNDGVGDAQEPPEQGGYTGPGTGGVNDPCEAADVHINQVGIDYDGDGFADAFVDPDEPLIVCAGSTFNLQFHITDAWGGALDDYWTILDNGGSASCATFLGDPEANRLSPWIGVNTGCFGGGSGGNGNGGGSLLFGGHSRLEDGSVCSDAFEVIAVDLEVEIEREIILVNNDDRDADGIPGFADGFDLNPGAEHAADDLAGADHFVPLRVTIPPIPGEPEVTLSLSYAASDPSLTTVTPDPEGDVFAPGPGKLRIWMKDAAAQRDKRPLVEGGDFVASGTYPLSSFDAVNEGGEMTFWVEAVGASVAMADLGITVTFADCPNDAVHVTAYSTQYVALDGSGFVRIRHPQISEPSSTIALTQYSLTNLRPSDDGLRLVADIVVQGTVNDPVLSLMAQADMSALLAQPGNTQSYLAVHVNGEYVELPSGANARVPVTWSQTATDGPASSPYQYAGVFHTTIPAVEVNAGWNSVRLMAHNKHGFTGYTERHFEMIAIAPPDETFNVEVAFVDGIYNGTTATLRVWRNGTLVQDVPLVGDRTGTYENLGFGIVLRVVEPPPAPNPEVPDQIHITITDDPLNLSNEPFWTTETGLDSLVFTGDTLIEEAERMSWEGYSLSTGEIGPIKASTGGTFSPFFIQVIGPPDLATLVPDATIGDRTYPLVSLQDMLFLGRVDGTNRPEPFLATRSFLQGVVPPGEWRSGALNFTKGFGAGLWDTGVSFVDSVKTVGKGTWYGIKNYHPYVIVWRVFVDDGEVVLEEDQQRLDAACEMVSTLATVVSEIAEQSFEVTEAALNGDVAELAEFGLDHMLMIEYIVELSQAVEDEIDNLDDYEAGRIIGRIIGEVVVEVAPALLSGGASLALKSSIVAKVGTKLDNLPDTTIPPAVKEKVVQVVTHMVEFATTKMCFVAGTLVVASRGLVPIEEIRVGDMVLSRDVESGEQGFKPVVSTITTFPDRLWHITYQTDGSSNGLSTITCTGEHPFFVAGEQGFVPAELLWPGDELSMDEGSSAFVTDIQTERGPPRTVECHGDARYGWNGRTFTTYNIEVADWHTYFVGGQGGAVWVHNAARAPCQRAFGIISKIKKDNPGISHWDAFVEALNRTDTLARKQTFDRVLDTVSEALMQAMFKDAIRPDGTVDLTSLKTVTEINQFRYTPGSQGVRLQGLDLHCHHIFPQAWAKVLYRRVHGEDAVPDGGWQVWLDSMPGHLVDKHYHVHHKVNDDEGIAAFHRILDGILAPETTDRNAILGAIEEAYQLWDQPEGPTIWTVAKAWLENEGL